MKNLMLSALVVVSLTAFVGCADDNTTTTTHTRSYSMDRNDPKEMNVPPADENTADTTRTTTTTVETDNSANGPGIHSNGQGAGQGY